jgi:sugar/nucleoside kinase (ribokinase family)
MIGVGGIGSGSFFLLNGNHTLGREESRSGSFLEKNDYCKLHIISHYVKALLGPSFNVLPVGKIGNDEIGEKLLTEMKEIDLSLDYIEIDIERPTLFSFCFLYPDKSGGNLTTDDSACSTVDEEFVLRAEKDFENYKGKGIALAVPEVPMNARIKLLELAAKYDLFSVGSFTSGEMSEVINSGVLEKVNLLCINIDEAANAVNINASAFRPVEIVEYAVQAFTSINPRILVSITNGKDGSYSWNGSEISFLPAVKVNAVSTAGAGDAFTAGLIAGIAAGLPLKDAQQLASLTGACSVTSPHTINKELDRTALLKTDYDSTFKLSEKVLKVLED